MPKLKIKRVKSWKETPHPEYPASIKAFTDLPTHTIYIKKSTPLHTIEHEKFHLLKRHPSKPRNPTEYAEQEIKAHLYTYHKTGKPTHILGELKATFNDLNYREYHLSPRQSLSIIRKVLLNNPGVPASYKEDYSKLLKECKKVFK